MAPFSYKKFKRPHFQMLYISNLYKSSIDIKILSDKNNLLRSECDVFFFIYIRFTHYIQWYDKLKNNKLK